MKDYYSILGVPREATPEEIKTAFRKLAFQHHPDVNPGREKQAEERFKEINEAYGVLCDVGRRQQYDYACRSGFAGAGSSGGYAQSDVFRDIFSNPAAAEELNRMFAQAGLRFDQDFINRVFASGQGRVYTFSFGPGGFQRGAFGFGAPPSGASPDVPVRKPGLVDRIMLKTVTGLTRFSVRTLFGVNLPEIKESLDEHRDIELTAAEAETGGEQQVIVKRGMKRKKLMVAVPADVKHGTTIRLKGMGKKDKTGCGDLYLHVRLREEPEGLLNP